MPILGTLPHIAEDVDRLTESERQRLYSLASVRGFRIQTNNRTGTHTIIQLRRGAMPWIGRERYASKKEARRALLRLMLTQTRRSVA